MSEEEKEQWLYEEYQYTSNFDFNRLDKYEEANEDLCLDDLILDYTMLYEHYKKEIERLNNIINEFDKWLEVNLTNLEKEETSNIYNEGLKQGMLSNGRLIKSKLQELKGKE